MNEDREFERSWANYQRWLDRRSLRNPILPWGCVLALVGIASSMGFIAYIIVTGGLSLE